MTTYKVSFNYNVYKHKISDEYLENDDQKNVKFPEETETMQI